MPGERGGLERSEQPESERLVTLLERLRMRLQQAGAPGDLEGTHAPHRRSTKSGEGNACWAGRTEKGVPGGSV